MVSPKTKGNTSDVSGGQRHRTDVFFGLNLKEAHPLNRSLAVVDDSRCCIFTSFTILWDTPETNPVLQPPPVNCTATPTNPVCHNVTVPPAPSPHIAPRASPPHNGPTVQPPKPSPPTPQPPKASPPQATPPLQPTTIPTIQPVSPTSVPSVTPQPAVPPTVNTVTPVVTAGPPTSTVTPQGPQQSTASSSGRRLMQVARPQQ